MKKFIDLLLVFVFIICFSACSGDGISDGYVIDSSYSVVFDEDSDAMYSAAKKIQSAVKDTYGVMAALKPDTFVKSGSEIVVGSTSRGVKQNEMKLKDYAVTVESNGDIFICGGSDAATEAALNDFIGRYLSEKHRFKTSDSFFKQYEYKYNAISLNGIDIAEYTVVSNEGISSEAAAMLNLKISDNLGIELPVASDTAEEIGKAIRIGVGDKSGRPVFSPLDYAIYADGDDIVLNASETALSQTDAIEKFIELFDGEAENGRLSIEISEDFKIVEGKKYSMEFVSAKRTAVLRNGVNQYEFHYKNLNGSPVIVYVMEVKADSGCRVAVGTPYDGDVVGNGRSQTVLDMANAGRANGKDIIFALNSGFFALSSDQMPEGVVIKDGKILSKGYKNFFREWWGVKTDGTLEFGTYDELYLKNDVNGTFRSDLKQAAGGNHLLYKDGEEVDIADSDTSLLAANPRSCFMQRKNGDIVLMVADGRQPGISVGLTMEEEKEIAFRMGAYDALNLDGGGSSQFVAWNEASHGLKVINTPVGLPGESAGHRKVADCIWLIAD